MEKKIKGVKSFRFLKTKHSGPLSQLGRDNYDKMDWDDHPKDKRK